MKRLVRHLGLFFGYGLLGVAVTVIAMAVIFLNSREPLQIWHTVNLDAEFRGDGSVGSFDDLLLLEERLFTELEEEVSEQIPRSEANLLNRYHRESLSAPDRWAVNWNRTFVMEPAEPRAHVLMLHGMSDSPYSFRAIAERLHGDGVSVIGLRYPGHGTAPGSLTETTWEDMAAAAELALRHLRARLEARGDDAPLYVFGYSTGGPLALELVVRALEKGDRVPDGLILFSPAMGLTPVAGLAPWQGRLGRLLGVDQFKWNSVGLEYDPFKYRSFPLNAAIQVWRLATHVDQRLGELHLRGEMDRLPPILSFQSVVDATITVDALLRVLYDRLPEGRHGLVAYDYNRTAGVEVLLSRDPRETLEAGLANAALGFDLSVVTNAGRPEQVVMRHGVATGREDCVLGHRWPEGVYSLSHVALTFPPDDPLYGGADAKPSPGIQLGDVTLRGERGALRIAPGDLLRQTWNPFFDEQYAELAFFMGLTGPPPCVPAASP